MNGLLGFGPNFLSPAGMMEPDMGDNLMPPTLAPRAPIETGVPDYIAPEKQGLMSRIGTYFQDPGNRRDLADILNTLAIGFDSMTLRGQGPITQLAAANLAESRKKRERESQTKAYVEYLRKQGLVDESQAAQLMKSPTLAAALTQEAIEAQFRAPKESFVAVSGRDLLSRGYSGVDANKMYNISSTGKISQVGGGGVSVSVGGQQMTPGFEALDKAYADEHLQWTRGGGADMKRQIAQIGSVLNKFESGQQLSGTALNFAPDFFQAVFAPQSLDAKQQVEDVVQRNLRTVLGAQFTEKEGERLISRAYDQRLDPKVNARRLKALFSQMSMASQQRDAMAQYFANNGTLMGYTGPQPNINDFYTALSARRVGDIVTNPVTGQKYEYLGGDETQESSWRLVK
jgi:hypothetical protein